MIAGNADHITIAKESEIKILLLAIMEPSFIIKEMIIIRIKFKSVNEIMNFVGFQI